MKTLIGVLGLIASSVAVAENWVVVSRIAAPSTTITLMVDKDSITIAESPARRTAFLKIVSQAPTVATTTFARTLYFCDVGPNGEHWFITLTSAFTEVVWDGVAKTPAELKEINGTNDAQNGASIGKLQTMQGDPKGSIWAVVCDK
jgi:hypothetical protein